MAKYKFTYGKSLGQKEPEDFGMVYLERNSIPQHVHVFPICHPNGELDKKATEVYILGTPFPSSPKTNLVQITGPKKLLEEILGQFIREERERRK